MTVRERAKALSIYPLVAVLVISTGLLVREAEEPPAPELTASVSATDATRYEQIVLRREAALARAARSAERAEPPAAAKPKPKPAPKPSPAPVKKSPAPAKAKPVYIPTSASVTMACIRKHESGNNYRAVNSTGKFQGAYQLHSGYAPAWAKRYGQAKWAGVAVRNWPPAVQDAVALGLGKDSHWRAWSDHTSYSCPGFRS